MSTGGLLGKPFGDNNTYSLHVMLWPCFTNPPKFEGVSFFAAYCGIFSLLFFAELSGVFTLWLKSDEMRRHLSG